MTIYAFCRDNVWWLEDFVMFDLLRRRHDGAGWNKWPEELKHAHPRGA